LVFGGKLQTLDVFVVAEKLRLSLLQHHVPGRQLEVFIVKLDQHIVEVLNLLSIALGLERNILIGDAGANLQILADISFELQVQSGIDKYILRIPKGNTAGQTPCLVEVSGWKEFLPDVKVRDRQEPGIFEHRRGIVIRHQRSIRKSLIQTDSNRAVTNLGRIRLFRRIKINLDNPI